MTTPSLQAVSRVLPPHYATQDELVAALRTMWHGAAIEEDRLEALRRSVQVRGRHTALPIAAYAGLDSFGARNRAWTQAALELGGQAVGDALTRAGLGPRDVDHVFFVTVTGVATPSIDARLVNRLGLRPDVKRTPIFGLGCVAGAAGLARASDSLRAFPDETAVLLSVELCSLTFQRGDLSVANVIASVLFGDGAAAVVLRGGEVARGGAPRVVATQSVFFPDTEHVMGWDVVDSGFKVLLTADVPTLVASRVRGDVDAFLAAHGLARSDIAHWVVHTGGPKVLEAFASALELPHEALAQSWESLRSVGNLSSASVLFVLADLLASGTPREGDLGLVMAMGPGFCAELVLLRW